MRAMLIALMFAMPVAAEEAWSPMDGAEISAALTGQVLEYGNGWQDFRASGRTLYHTGRDSWGYWEVHGDQYCSMWPPSDLWTCYGMARRGDVLRFIGAAGDTTDGLLRAEAE